MAGTVFEIRVICSRMEGCNESEKGRKSGCSEFASRPLNSNDENGINILLLLVSKVSKLCVTLHIVLFSVAPVIKVPNQLLGAPLNTDVQLECYVEAFPNTINYWVKNRGEMLLNG